MSVVEKVSLGLVLLFLVVACVRLFSAPLKVALRVLINSVLGFGALWLLNLTGGVTGIALGLNIFCSHAEMEAIREANRALGSWRLEDCTLYVTLEPCPMCAGAILSARIPRVYYGARDRAMGACGGVLNLFMEDFPARPALVGGVLREECHQVLADFFRSLRGPNGQKREI